MTVDELLDSIEKRLPGARTRRNGKFVTIPWNDRHPARQLVAELDDVLHSRMNTAIIDCGDTRVHLVLDVPAEYAYTITAWACLWYHDQDPTFLPGADSDYLARLLSERFTAIVWELDFGDELETDERVETLARLLADRVACVDWRLESAGELAASVTAANIDLVHTAVTLSSRTIRLPGARETACLPAARAPRDVR